MLALQVEGLLELEELVPAQAAAVVQVEVKSPPHFGILMMLSKTDDEWV